MPFIHISIILPYYYVDLKKYDKLPNNLITINY